MPSDTSRDQEPSQTQRLPFVPRFLASQWRSLGTLRSVLLIFGVFCQLATLWINWNLRQVRETPPHLPTFDLPQISVGIWLVLSLILTCIRPKAGLALHWALLVAAAVLDQMRLQPQFFANALLMTACVSSQARIFTRWFLVSTWFWAGLHKLLSSDWFGHGSYWLVERAGVSDPDRWYFQVAVAVALIELLLGCVALIQPRWSAIACVPVHLGIALTLTPLCLDWNESVIPWNLLMAAVGCWIMWQAKRLPQSRLEWAAALFWMLSPLGFFVGWLDHGFAGVLYSDCLPRGLITRTDGDVHDIRGWGELNVPFPYERRTLRIYFEQDANPGDKLHIADPRSLLDDLYFVLDAEGRAVAIDADTFYSPGPASADRNSVAGIGLDQARSIFALKNAGVRMLQRSIGEPVYAVAFTPENYSQDLLSCLRGLPNLTQVQLAGTDVQDEDLRTLNYNRLLTGIGLENTSISDTGLKHLSKLPFLQYVETTGSQITPEGLAEILGPDGADTH